MKENNWYIIGINTYYLVPEILIELLVYTKRLTKYILLYFCLLYIYCFAADLGNTTINGGGGLVLGRGPSPAIVDTPNLGPLAANSLLNGGFQSLSSSTSPILSQGAGKIIPIFVYTC